MSNKLKPCPHCGREDCCISAVGGTKQERWLGNIYCRNCNMIGPDIGPEDTYEAWFEKAVKVWNALPRRLQWTTKTPTEPGWYWYRLNEKDNISIVYVDVYGTVITYYPNLCPDGWSQQNLKNIHGQWAGPIPRPKDRNLCYDDRQRDIVTTS